MRNCLRRATNLATYLTARTEASESSKTTSSLVSCVLFIITTSKPELKAGFLQLGMILYFIHLLLNAQFVPPAMTRITLAGTNGNDTLIVFYLAVQSLSESHTRTLSIQPRLLQLSPLLLSKLAASTVVCSRACALERTIGQTQEHDQDTSESQGRQSVSHLEARLRIYKDALSGHPEKLPMALLSLRARESIRIRWTTSAPL
jgi:hypothetical protein